MFLFWLVGEMETEVVNVILELASPGNPDEYRADAVTVRGWLSNILVCASVCDDDGDDGWKMSVFF